MDHFENTHASTITCLSAENHDCDIKDYMLHYLGCLEICEREDFFKDTNPLWEEEIKHQNNVCDDLEQARRLVLEKREVWKTNCDSELRRINFLRKTLAQDPDDKHLVEQITKSSAIWRSSESYTTNIGKVRVWRERQGKGSTRPTDVEIEDTGYYELEKDVNVSIIQFEDGAGVNIRDDRVWNKFPNQETTLSSLLQDEDSLLDKKYSPNRLRYFHIPSNNMIWAEQAIARYHGDERPDYHATHRELIRKKKTSTYMILREPYWRSQFHGGQQQSPPHERHLGPICTAISSDAENKNHFPQNMVLFMPYLYWETSRKREQFAAEIESIMDSTIANTAEYEMFQKKRRQESRRELSTNLPNTLNGTEEDIGLLRGSLIPKTDDRFKSWQPTSNSRFKSRAVAMNNLLNELQLSKHRLQVDYMGRVNVKNTLGQFLLDAARLYEGMSNYRDKKLLHKYLSADPPLHPRRTLDQAYYWTLKSTRKRDRDQVVYRGTTARHEDFHTYDCVSEDSETRSWTKHEEFGIKGPCNDCKMNIQKLSRVIMVDQLWMWILDANTIITCFPKQYGADTQDSSGIHKSIRMRLQDSDPDIRTVFDIALIIIDECSKALFDRTNMIDRQPQVIDIFSKAIGAIMYKQTAAFERVWRWSDTAIEIFKSKGSPDMSEIVPLLDINPEAMLEREIKDIIEELNIMIDITKIHRKMITTFITNAENILDPLGGKQKRQMAARYFSSNSKELADLEGTNSEDVNDTRKREEDYNWFKLNADETLENALSRINELEGLRDAAVYTTEGIKDILDLKQQEASLVQTWLAARQSEESTRQGGSIMMFTIVTTIFIPLSFMSSVFGMNNIEISGDSWSIREEFIYMFPISAGVIILSLILAFSRWIRSALYWLWTCFWTLVFVTSGIYDQWLNLGMPSESVYRSANEITDRLKEKAAIARYARKVKRTIEVRKEQAETDLESFETIADTGARISTRVLLGHGRTNIGSAV
ncbi:hypothetical protein F4818DRAFT_454561 [Hypoxylon cercidicola]|nr:hypothetical protein F4818DRAFT_454561 [Hypoxylon cercidicola]